MRLAGQAIRLLILVCLGSISFLFATTKTAKPFEIHSGLVKYDIKVTAQLTPETNLTVKAQAIFRFRDWGEIRSEEVNGFVKTTGALEYKESIKRFYKETKDTITTVYFEHEQLLERKKPSIKKDIQRIQINHLEKKGTQSVAGVICDVWEGIGIKKCIYKGIVLKLESHIYDLSYVKAASEVTFDTNTSEDCTFPNYPVQKFGLFVNHIKTINKAKPEDLYKIISDVAIKSKEVKQASMVSNFNSPKRKKFIQRISQDIFEKQKVLLPQLLQSMKKMRECLQAVENPFEANLCRESFTRIKSKLGNDENDYIVLWDDKRKIKLLDKIEDKIIDLESRITCVKRAKNIYDLSKCMK